MQQDVSVVSPTTPKRKVYLECNEQINASWVVHTWGRRLSFLRGGKCFIRKTREVRGEGSKAVGGQIGI